MLLNAKFCILIQTSYITGKRDLTFTDETRHHTLSLSANRHSTQPGCKLLIPQGREMKTEEL